MWKVAGETCYSPAGFMGGETTDSDNVSRTEYPGDAWLDDDVRAAFETESNFGPA